MEETVRKVTIGKWIGEGWRMVKDDIWNFVLLTLIYLLIMVAASFTYIGSLIVGGPLMCSYYYIIFQKMRGEKINIGDLGKGFSFFVHALLAYLLISAFTVIGLILCIIPGIVVGAMYIFAYPLIIEKGLSFWDAMEESRKIIWPNIVWFILFMIVCGLICLLGVLLCGVGALVTTPIMFCATACAYRDWVGLPAENTFSVNGK